MPKRPTRQKKKSQHDKFVEAARRAGADESEDAFKRALKKIARKQSEQKNPGG